MDFFAWTFLVGLFLLAMALGSAYLRPLPVSNGVLYLGVGWRTPPTGTGCATLSPAGPGLGFALGLGLGRLAIWVRQHTRDPQVSSDFLLLALIALAYAGAEFIHVWGFLAVFAAGVGLGRAEVRSVRRSPAP